MKNHIFLTVLKISNTFFLACLVRINMEHTLETLISNSKTRQDKIYIGKIKI